MISNWIRKSELFSLMSSFTNVINDTVAIYVMHSDIKLSVDEVRRRETKKENRECIRKRRK